MKITTGNDIVDLVNYYCPNDKNLSLDTIHVLYTNFLKAEDFNSSSESWLYDTMYTRVEYIEDWQDENKLILGSVHSALLQ